VREIVSLQIGQFALIYILLIIILIIMKKCKINQSKLLLIGSFRMTVQLILAGLILTYIIDHPHPIFTIIYLILMIGYAIRMVLVRNPGINKKFQYVIGISLASSGILIISFFLIVVVGVGMFDPQYTIPISGMIIGNALTGVSLGVKSFHEAIVTKRARIDTLLNIGVTPAKILTPFANEATETALLPTINNMMGMGIISLPGMMTGQILSGTMPMTAILYQIAIIIAITAVTCLSVFGALFFGFRTLYNKRSQLRF